MVDIKRICFVGGNLDERTDVNGIHDVSKVELKIMILTKSGFIHLWKSSDPTLTRCLIGFGRDLMVTDICLNNSSVGFVTREGDVFFANISDRKKKRDSDSKRTDPKLKTESKLKTVVNDQQKRSSAESPNLKSKSVQQVRSFVRYIDRDE